MALMDFLKKQFIDVIEWTEEGDGVIAWRYPMRDHEIQNGGQLTVRDTQAALFVNEGTIADLFGPGRFTLTTQTLPLLTNLKNWDKAFQSPFKSDVVFFSTRLQNDQRWGTAQPVTLRDKDFGAVRLRAFGNYTWRLADPRKFYTEVSGTRELYTAEDIDGQLRGTILQHLSDAVAQSGIPFLDLAANQIEFARQIALAVTPEFERLGLQLVTLTVQNVSLPDELQKILDQKIGMGIIGNNLGAFTQYQTAQAIPGLVAGGASGSVAGDAMGLGAGVAIGQVLAGNLAHGLSAPAGAPGGNAPVAPAAAVSPNEVMATLEKLAELKGKGILTEEEFASKKAELLKKLV